MEHAVGTKTGRGLLCVFMTLAVAVLLSACGDGTDTKLSAPENVKATAGEGTVTITWDAVQGAASYHLYWSKTAGAAAGGIMINVTGTSYVHEKLIYLQDYYYCVCAADANRESPPSDEVMNTPERLPIAHITFPDVNLDTCVDTYATNQGYTYADEITFLVCSSSSIADITGVGWLTGLTHLSLDFNSISDMSPVAGLTSLTQLYLYNNNISDMSAVAWLTSLTSLSLGGNSISDMSAVSGLTALTKLDLSGNSISDMSAVSGLTALTNLDLSGNSISDISAISRLTGLTYLYLDNNNISDISAVAGLTSLTQLYLYNNNISDISAVAGLTSLTYLFLSNNSITTGVATLTGLTSAMLIDFTGNNNIPCADLATLETALGAGIISHPASCMP